MDVVKFVQIWAAIKLLQEKSSNDLIFKKLTTSITVVAIRQLHSLVFGFSGNNI